MEPEICASIKVKRKSSKKNFSVLKMKFLSRGAFQHPSYSLVFCCQVATTVIIIWNQRTFMSYKCRFSHCYHKQIKPFLLFLRAVAVSWLITSYSHFFTPAAVRLPLNRVDLTNRFQVAVLLFNNRSQMSSKYGNKKVAHKAQPSVSLMFLPRFDVLCDLLLRYKYISENQFEYVHNWAYYIMYYIRL